VALHRSAFRFCRFPAGGVSFSHGLRKGAVAASPLGQRQRAGNAGLRELEDAEADQLQAEITPVRKAIQAYPMGRL